MSSTSKKEKYAYDLQLAIITSNGKKIDEIIQKIGFDIVNSSVRLINRSTPLSLAIYKNNHSALGHLLKHPFNLNRLSCDHLGRIEPPLCSAIRLGNNSIINKLLSFDTINVNQFDYFGQTPLWLAVQWRKFDTLQSILLHDSFRLNLSLFTKSKTSPVYLAAKYLKRGREEMFELLLKYGLPFTCLDMDHGGDYPDIDVEYIDGQTVLFEIALVHHAYHFISHLINSGLNVHCFRYKFANPIIRHIIGECYPRSLASECRLIIRKHFIQKLNRPITEELISENLPNMPRKLVKYISELS